jgi:hypothetical protein
MKNIILLFAFILSVNSFASEEQSFLHKAYCESGRNRESKISDIRKEREDEKSVTFVMTFTHGLCDSIELVRAPIKFQKKMLQVTHYGLSHPFKKIHVKVENFRSRSESELEARITLNKEALMVKDSRRYILDFWAGDWIGFPFVMTFTNKNDEVEISFEGFERL